MPHTRLLWQLFPTYLLITLVALLAGGLYAVTSVRQFYIELTAKNLEDKARMAQSQISPILDQPEKLTSVCKRIGKESSARITTILSNGKVVCDTDKNPQLMENHANRPEIQQALEGLVGSSSRFSETLQENYFYLGFPIRSENQVIGVVRISIPLTFIDEILNSIQSRIALGGLLVALLAVSGSLYIARRIGHPLEKIRKGAEKFAEGELKLPIPIPDSLEIGDLARTLNQMASQLDNAINTITTERNEKEAILSSMTEGILAVDNQERIIGLNKASGNLLGINIDDSRGLLVAEAIQLPGLIEFLQKAQTEQEALEKDLIVSRQPEKYLSVHGTALLDAEGRRIGALAVLNNVTQIRKLERARTDFVANVSHELKTPITSIKGFVETLSSGAVNEPKNAQRFLEIIARESDRLNAIIDDLLSLSRIEQDSESIQLEMEETVLFTILQNAARACSSQAKEKDVSLELDCDRSHKIKVNAPLLEQAASNLIQNAVKYSPKGGKVQVTANKNDKQWNILVTDSGCGIAQNHLPRLFERFYRVDRARSRELGGTGLGLAIVKHIVQAHGGSVAVESKLHYGSVFKIFLPQH